MTLCNDSLTSTFPDSALFNWVSKVITQLLWFCIATVCDWLKSLAPLFWPIRSKTKTNRDLPARVFPRLAPAVCICFDLWIGSMGCLRLMSMVRVITLVLYYDTQLKTALKTDNWKTAVACAQCVVRVNSAIKKNTIIIKTQLVNIKQLSCPGRFALPSLVPCV